VVGDYNAVFGKRSLDLPLDAHRMKHAPRKLMEPLCPLLARFRPVDDESQRAGRKYRRQLQSSN
jgi:hypothetical protein